MSDHARVIELRIRNVGPIEALDITPKGAITEVRGKNAAGKTTALNALSLLLEGAKSLPGVPIRTGATKGEIVGIIGETRETAKVFRRTITPKGGQLTVTTADGVPLASPQAVADALIEKTVRFQAFGELPAAEQHSVLAQVAGIDIQQFTKAHKAAYDERRVINRDVDRLAKEVAVIPIDAEVGTEMRDLMALSSELTAAHAKRRENDGVRARASELQGQFAQKVQYIRGLEAAHVEADKNTDRHIEDLEHQIEALTNSIKASRKGQSTTDKKHANDLALAEHERDTLLESGEKQLAIAEAIVDPDTSAIEQQIAEADTFNEKVRAQKRRAELIDKHAAAKAKSDALTAQMEQLDAEEQKAIREAPMPVEGLAYTPDGVMYNGLPFEQASATERDIVSVAVGCARNPKLKAMTFDNGEQMDAEHRKALYKMVNDVGMFAMVAIVDDSGKGDGVTIVEGITEESQ